MVRKHYWRNGHEFEQTPRDSEWQGSLLCYTVHGVAKSQTRLSDSTTKNFNEHKMYKDVIYDNNNIKDEDGNYIEVDFSMLLKPHTHTHTHTHTEVAQSCPTLCDPMDCSPPGSSVHGIFQAWILEWVAISFSNWSQVDINLNHSVIKLILIAIPMVTTMKISKNIYTKGNEKRVKWYIREKKSIKHKKR